MGERGGHLQALRGGRVWIVPFADPTEGGQVTDEHRQQDRLAPSPWAENPEGHRHASCQRHEDGDADGVVLQWVAGPTQAGLTKEDAGDALVPEQDRREDGEETEDEEPNGPKLTPAAGRAVLEMGHTKPRQDTHRQRELQ